MAQPHAIRGASIRSKKGLKLSTTSEIYNEVLRFVEGYKSSMGENGLVQGEMTPNDVLMLGYTLIAMVITEKNTVTPEELINNISTSI